VQSVIVNGMLEEETCVEHLQGFMLLDGRFGFTVSNRPPACGFSYSTEPSTGVGFTWKIANVGVWMCLPNGQWIV